jgi:hypothetical protein
MPNATTRADAQTLPEAPTRRAALGTIIAVGAIGVVPIAAGPATAAEPVSAPAGIDSGLFALIDEAREAGARVEAAIGVLEEAQERTEEVPWPQALIVTEDDTRLWKLKAGDPFDHVHVYRMRGNQLHRRKLKDSISRLDTATLAVLEPWAAIRDDKGRATIEKLKAKDAREDQLIAAMDHRCEALRVASDRSGETAAEERLKQLMDEKYAAYARVANARAWTLNGVLAKLALVAPDVDDDSASDLPTEVGTSEPILFSVAVDFKALKAGEVRA